MKINGQILKLVNQFSIGILLLICSTSSFAQEAAVLNWAKSIGGTTNDLVSSITTDALGNVYTTGDFRGTVDFDPGPAVFNLTSQGSADIFISKLDASGNLVWARAMGGSSGDGGNSIAIDALGNVYTTGTFRFTSDFDPGPGTFNLTDPAGAGGADIFVSKLDASGNFIWAKQLGGPEFDNSSSIAVDNLGNVLTTGYFQLTADFDPGPATFNLTSAVTDIFVSKLDALGNFVWAKAMGGTGVSEGQSITTDLSGNIYTTGQFDGVTDFDPSPGVFNLTTASEDIFVSKLNASGNFVWAKQLGGASSDYGFSIAVDASGNVHTTGSFASTADFDPGAGIFNLTSLGALDIFVSKLDTNGNFIWARQMGGTGFDESLAIALDASGNVFTTGAFQGTVDFDPGSGTYNLTDLGILDIYVSKLDASGNFAWAVQMGGTSSESGTSIAVDDSFNLFITGDFSGTVDFDPNAGISTLTSLGGTDFFVQKLSLPLPTITSFTPASGTVGTTVTITGTNFSTTPANNIVYFGATKATVTAATTTQLTVTVPTGATYQPISVLVSGLTAFSNKPFITTFADGGVIDACSFAAKADITTGSAPYSVAIGDLDSDGKPDLAVANETGNTVSVYKNISTLGSLGSSSFAAKVDFVTGASPYFVMIQDLDGDGKPELIATINGTDKVSIFKNNTTVGVINSSSFAAKVDFSTGQNPWIATVADFDQDGKPDLAIVNDVDNSVSILKNTSTTGVINASSFAPKVDFATGTFPIGIASADLDGDGKVDLAVTNQTANTISVLRNTCTPGNIDATSFDPKIDLATGLSPYSVAIGDLDGDNKPEIAVANYGSGSVSVLGNAGTVGTINFLAKEDFSSGASSGTVSISDMDGNGKPDLNITSATEGISVLKNIGTSTPISASSFSPRVNFSVPNPYGLAIADLDGNGKPDVVSTNASGATASILRNTVSSLPSLTGGSFTPTGGPVGTVVTITGANFSTTPLNNTVKFNGTVAIVTASTSTSITTSVPVGATTGSISLEVGCVQAFTIFPFTVTTGATITITTQPADASICAGATTSLTTAATGTINITYQWQRYILAGSLLQNITNGGAYSGATTATLTINSSAGPLSGDFYTCVVSGDNATPVSTNYVTLTVSPSLSAPLTTDASSCIPAAIILTASGGINGQYRWYATSTGGTNIPGEVNSTYTTPVLSTTTTYYVAINNGSCESGRTPVIATINSSPAKPTITSSITPSGSSVSVCSSNVLTLSAPAGFSTYTWSPAGSVQQILASTSGNYSVVVTNAAGCASVASDVLIVTVIPAPCSNQAPVIVTASTTTQIEGKVSLDLVSLISDADNNIDIQSLKIKVPPVSGAKASITTSGLLELDYQGLSFAGMDMLTIEVCDLLGDCTQQEIKIDVIGDLNIYTGISPNGDPFNDMWIIQYIEAIAETKNNTVSVYNRWGDLVWETENYDNQDRVFKGLNKNGNELPSGTYFYKIEFGSGRKALNGYLSLKR